MPGYKGKKATYRKPTLAERLDDRLWDVNDWQKHLVTLNKKKAKLKTERTTAKTQVADALRTEKIQKLYLASDRMVQALYDSEVNIDEIKEAVAGLTQAQNDVKKLKQQIKSKGK